MTNRQQRRQRGLKSPKPVNTLPAPMLNVFAKEGLLIQQVTLGPGYVAEFRLPIDLAENYVKECQEVLTELRTGLKVEKSSGLITP